MALFTGFFDASGDWKNQPFVVVSGYIANYLQWKALEGMWKQVHEEHRVELPFHMADFAAACFNENYKNQSNARADYVEIAKDPILRGAFFAKILACQATIVSCAVACVVRMNVYSEIDELIKLRETIPPYALAARHCVERIHKWEQDYEVAEPIELIFEEGDFGQGEFSRLMEREGLPIPIYRNKKDFAGLQMADHYAWEMYNQLKTQEKGLQRAVEYFPRPEMITLLHSIPRLHVEPTRESILNVCQGKGIKARARQK